MKFCYLITSAALLFFTASSFSQKRSKIDLHKLAKHKGLTVINRDLSLINEKGYQGIRLSQDYGEGIVWLKGIEVSNGILEFDVRGADIQQHSFVGIAFHGINDSTFDAIYLRPFQFQQDDPVLKSRDIQYISLPAFTWQILRGKSPGKYEHAIEPAPDPDSWIRMRIEIKDSIVKVYINGNKEPSLAVEKVTQVRSGSVGFYVADTSGGDFANITITKTD